MLDVQVKDPIAKEDQESMLAKRIVLVMAACVTATAMCAGTAHAEDAWFISNQFSKLCIGVASSMSNSAPAIQYQCNDASDELWWFDHTTDSRGGDAVFLRNNYSQKCLGVASSLTKGTGVIQYTCNQAVDEKWYDRLDGTLVNVYSGLCLGAASSLTGGTQLIQYTCNGASDEDWSLFVTV